MKKAIKFFAIAAFALFIGSNAYAQDLSQAGELYNNAATALNEGNSQAALDGFNQALAAAEALGEEGAELSNNCKNIIPKLYIQLGKEAASTEDMAKAAELLGKAHSLATEWGKAEEANDAKETLVQVYIAGGNSLLNEKKYDEAIASYTKATEVDPANGLAYLRIGMCEGAKGNTDGAIEAYTKASENGEEANAKKQMGNLYAKKAVACYKAKDNQGAVDAAVKASEYGNSAAAKIGGICAFNLKKNDQAISLLEPLADETAKTNDVKYYLARAYEAKANNAKACTYYKAIASDAKYKAYADSKVASLCK
ncbi:MAG: tetratricopeptide repeat protein [Bacteroidia bacterium]|nr:tetratricopeptide repeat protein [Bacteroidia bacterium]